MSRLKDISMALSVSVPLIIGAAQSASSEEWKGTYSNWCDLSNYVCSLPERAIKFLDEMDKELLDKADEVEEAASDFAEFASPLATAAAQSDLDKIIPTAIGDVTQKIGQKTLAAADKLTTIVKVAGSLSTDKPDYVGASEAVFDGAVGGKFAAVGGAIGTVATGLLLGSNPIGWAAAAGWGIGAVGGAVVYMNTVQPETSKAFEAIASEVRDSEFKDNMEEAERQSSKIKQAQLDKLNCLGNSVAIWNKGHPICICPDKNTRWLKALSKCVTKYEARDNCKQYPGSIISMNAPKGCECPAGTKWSKNLGRCAKDSVKNPVVVGGQCPMKNPYKKDSHKRDTNGNPNDRTFLHCKYLTDKLIYQTPYRDGKKHGVAIVWELDRKSGRHFKLYESLHTNGKRVKHAQFRPDGTVAYSIND